jgi:hypothetical protein
VRQKFDLERFVQKNLSDIEVKEKYQVKISSRYAVLESLDESFDINNAWESIREYQDLNQRKSTISQAKI